MSLFSLSEGIAAGRPRLQCPSPEGLSHGPRAFPCSPLPLLPQRPSSLTPGVPTSGGPSGPCPDPNCFPSLSVLSLRGGTEAGASRRAPEGRRNRARVRGARHLAEEPLGPPASRSSGKVPACARGLLQLFSDGRSVRPFQLTASSAKAGSTSSLSFWSQRLPRTRPLKNIPVE